MQTQVMHERKVGQPWLERDSADGGPAEQTALDSFPFLIGRDDGADLVIPSSRVSREHAVIVRTEDDFRLQDLGSTNGTLLNGARITDVPLSDGDILVVADIEFTFFCKRGGAVRDTVTQPLDMQGTVGNEGAAAEEIIREVRRLQESLTHGCLETWMQPIVCLDGGTVFGYEALFPGNGFGPLESPAQRGLLATDCRLTSRLRRLHRLVVVEEASRLPGETCVFLNLDESEIGAERLAASLGRLRSALSENHRLVVEVPDSAVSDTPYCRAFRQELQEMGIGIAYDGFAAGQMQVMQHKDIRPDFIKLADSLVRGIHRNGERQRQVQAIVQAGREIGSEIVAVGLRNEEEAMICAKLGCRFGQGYVCGRPQTIQALLGTRRPQGDFSGRSRPTD